MKGFKRLFAARKSSQRGFTLVELLIASSVFSFILLGASAALVQIGRMYYKGVISSQTQGTARTVIDDISRTIQFSGKDLNIVAIEPTQTDDSPRIGVFCIGNDRYTYALNAQVNDEVTGYEPSTSRSPHALFKDRISGPNSCSSQEDGSEPTHLDITDPNTTANSDGRELLSEHMRVTNFSITPDGDDVFNVSITIIYGDNDLLVPDSENPSGCSGNVVGGQWCAVSTLSTTVTKRIQ